VEKRGREIFEEEQVNNRELETPRKKQRSSEGVEQSIKSSEINTSPEIKRLLEMQNDVAWIIECRRVEKMFREKHKMEVIRYLNEIIYVT